MSQKVRIYFRNQGHAEQDQDAYDANADLKESIDPQRMMFFGDQTRQQQAAFPDFSIIAVAFAFPLAIGAVALCRRLEWL